VRETEDLGLDTASQAVVMCAVFAVVLLGMVVLAQRQAAIDAFAQAGGEAVAIGGADDGASASPTPVPTPLPPPDAGGPDTYTVQRGDSLFSVASDLGLSPNELIFWNQQSYPTLQSTPALTPGWVLRTTGPPLPRATPQPTPTPTPVPQIAAPDIPGLPSFGPGDFPASAAVTVSYYAVSGTTPLQIDASIRQNGPWSEWAQQNIQAQVEVSPSFNFGFQSSPFRGCSIVLEGDVPLTLSYEVLLPSWTPPPGVPPATVDWWTEIIVETVAHESHHISLYEQFLPAMNEAVRTGTCDSVEADLERLWTDASRANCEFDLAEYGYAIGLSLESCLQN